MPHEDHGNGGGGGQYLADDHRIGRAVERGGDLSERHQAIFGPIPIISSRKVSITR